MDQDPWYKVIDKILLVKRCTVNTGGNSVEYDMYEIVPFTAFHTIPNNFDISHMSSKAYPGLGNRSIFSPVAQ